MDFKRTPQKFIFAGLDLNHPTDLMPQGKYPYAQNVRSYQEGRFEPRAGLTRLNSSPVTTNIHSLSRTNDYVSGQFIRWLGVDNDLWFGQTAFSQLATGFSGNPLSFVPYRPEQADSVWTYIADKSKLIKANVNGEVFQTGITPPTTIPHIELLPPLYTSLASFNSSSGWGNQTPAGAVSLGARLNGVSIGQILYAPTVFDSTGGWACIWPSGGNINDIQAGMRIFIGSEETTVEDTFSCIVTPAPTTIQSIVYDSGNSGTCTIQPSQTIKGLTRNLMLQVGGVLVRVVSIVNAADGSSSFRCSTGTTSITSGATITVPVLSLWVHLTGTHVSGEPITANQINFSVTNTTPGTIVTGVINVNFGTPTLNLLSIAGRALSPDDYIHVGVWMDNPANLVEGKLILDVDRGTTGSYTSADGNSNAYYKSFRQSDFQPVITQAQTQDISRTDAIQSQIQDDASVLQQSATLDPASQFGLNQSNPSVNSSIAGNNINPLAAPTSQLTLGQSQWTEFIWKLSDLIRLGSDDSVDLSQVRAMQFRFTVSATLTVAVGGLWVGGGYGPDTGTNLTPFQYRFRYRSSQTGAKSLTSPATYSGILSRRQGVIVTPTPSQDPQVDRVDIERLGGTDVDSWNFVGTLPNGAGSIPAMNANPFVDMQLSAAILDNPALETDTYVPFTVSDIPRAATVNVAGSTVQWTGGDQFNPRWAKGTAVIVNGITTSLYGSPLSPTIAYLADSIGTLSGPGAYMEIPEPAQTATPLPVLWGPFYNTMFAVGNPLDAGVLYFTKPFDPDSSADTNQIEVTSPSEALMNGCMYDGLSFVFSDQRMFRILPTGQSQWEAVEIPNGKGLWSRWAIAVGPRIWFLGPDGIYETTGGEPINISGDIQPLFPQGEQQGFAVNGLNPVQMFNPGGGSEGINLRLSYHNNYLYFDYLDTLGNNVTLVYNTLTKAWGSDKFSLANDGGINCRLSESGFVDNTQVNTLLIGANNGFVYTDLGTSDDGQPIACQVGTPSFNAGDTRSYKLFGDIVLDIDPQNTNIVVTPFVAKYQISLPSTTFNNPNEYVTPPIDLGGGEGVFEQNLSLLISWASATQSPKLYYWEPSYLDRPENTGQRATDWDNAGEPGSKWLQGFLLTADTLGVNKTITVRGDQGNLQSYVINHNGEETKPYVLTPPRDVILIQLLGDSIPWRLFGVKWVFEPSPELVTDYHTQGTTHDLPGYQFLKDGYIAHQSTADITLDIGVDGVHFVYTIPSSGGKFSKTYFVASALASGQTAKGRLFFYHLYSQAPFKLFLKDCEVRIHVWNQGGYQIIRPFGDLSRTNGGARI